MPAHQAAAGRQLNGAGESVEDGVMPRRVDAHAVVAHLEQPLPADGARRDVDARRLGAAVKELLADGKSPNVRQRDGVTPLMIAASNGDAEIAAMLLAKGADPNARAAGKSALSIEKSRGSAGAGVVQLLERSGARD